MAATILAYGYDSKELKRLKSVCARLDIRLRRVTEAEYARPIGSFFHLAPDGDSTEDVGSIPGRMMVLSGVSDKQLDVLLSSLKTARAGDSLKAVLTEHNARWTGPALYAELAKERMELEKK